VAVAVAVLVQVEAHPLLKPAHNIKQEMAAVEFQIPSQVYLLLMVAVAVAEVAEISISMDLQLFVRAAHRKQEMVEAAAAALEGYAQILRHPEQQIPVAVAVAVACIT
jgi:hypothetical protein